jgi:hypothetical protein
MIFDYCQKHPPEDARLKPVRMKRTLASSPHGGAQLIPAAQLRGRRFVEETFEWDLASERGD